MSSRPRLFPFRLASGSSWPPAGSGRPGSWPWRRTATWSSRRCRGAGSSPFLPAPASATRAACWPSAYPSGGRRLPNPGYPGARTDSFLPADFEFQAHSAPLQAAFYGGSLFPPEYRGALFVAFHGSWNRDPPTGYKIVAVSFKDGKPVSVSDFATGRLAKGRVLGRPVGLAFAADGSMYVSDDTGYLFRITPFGL
jgi:hypothetical protein